MQTILDDVKLTLNTDATQIRKSIALLDVALAACERDDDVADVLAWQSLLFGKAKLFEECLEDAQRLIGIRSDFYIGYLQ